MKKLLTIFFFCYCALLTAQEDTLLVKIAADTLSSDLQEGGISAEALSLYNTGLLKAQSSETDSAIMYFTQAIELQPSFSKAYYNRSSAFLALENLSGALLDIDQYLSLVDTASSGYITRAEILDALERDEDAIAAYKMAIQRKDEPAVAHLAIGNYSLRESAYREAVDNFTAYLRYHPSDGLVLHDRGSAYQMLDDLKLAERDYRQATLVEPDLASAFANLGSVLRKRERYEEAVDAYTDALKIEPNDAMVLNNRGYAYFLNEEYDKAVDDFEEAIKLSSDYAYAYNNLASAHIKLEQYQEAVDAASAALKIDANYGFAYLNRGIAREMIRDLPGACSDWEMAEKFKIKNAANYRGSICKFVE
ncbi:MAG: tetratricopeptide repeat protein [Flavobacteriales bacterium]|nr:tetratricopeptide repeat protein [Flavobacteriales bacterium]